MKCPDCEHEAEYHNPLFGGCQIGECNCQKFDAEIYLALLTEARQVIAPFASVEHAYEKYPDDQKISDDYVLMVENIRNASAFLAKTGETE